MLKSKNLTHSRFSSAKEKYYKNIKTLMTKLNKEVERENKDTEVENKANIESSILLEEEKILCQICKKKDFKYKCPKCKLEYCSVECYKSHNLECTEEFYKQNVLEELKSTKVDEEDGKKFRKTLRDYHQRLDKILNKSHSDTDLSQERESHLQNLLQKIEDGSIDMTIDLTPEDWKEFNNFINGYFNNRQKMLIYKPFWENRVLDFEPSLDIYDASLFQDLDQNSILKLKEVELNEYIEYFENNSKKEEDDIEDLEEIFELENETHNSEINQIVLNNNKIPINRELIYKAILLKFKEVPRLNKLSVVKPNDSNFNTLCHLICNITFFFRLYNGDINENIDEIVPLLMQNCKILYDKNIIFENINVAVLDFLQHLSKMDPKNFNRTKHLVLTDLKSVLNNKFFIYESLIRLYEILHRFNKSSFKIVSEQKITKMVSLAKNKIIYFMSYLKDLSYEFIQTKKEETENLSFL